MSAMPAFGKDGILKPEEIREVANYVRTLDGLEPEQGVDVAAGKKIFADNCAACHGDDGKGNIEMGAPNLTTKVWQYGSNLKDLTYTITYARNSDDAGLGRAPRSGDDQVAGGLRSQPGRRTVSVSESSTDESTTRVPCMRRRQRSIRKRSGGPIAA